MFEIIIVSIISTGLGINIGLNLKSRKIKMALKELAIKKAELDDLTSQVIEKNNKYVKTLAYGYELNNPQPEKFTNVDEALFNMWIG